jgi:hypothetical protein
LARDHNQRRAKANENVGAHSCGATLLSSLHTYYAAYDRGKRELYQNYRQFIGGSEPIHTSFKPIHRLLRKK